MKNDFVMPPKFTKVDTFDSIFRTRTLDKHTESEITSFSNMLHHTLGNRVRDLRVWVDKHLFIGLNLNSGADPLRQFDKGPHPNDPESKEFSQFYGDKAVIKSYPGGSVALTVEWGSDPIVEIITFVYAKVFHTAILFNQTTLDFTPLYNDLPRGNPSKAYEDVVQLLHTIPTTVRIISLRPISIFMRNTAPFNPLPNDGSLDYVPLCPQSIRIAAQLESSSAWPDAIRALVQFKIAIAIDIAKNIKREGYEALPHTEGLYIAHGGYVFNLVFYHTAEYHHFMGLEHGNYIKFLESCETAHHSYIFALSGRFPQYKEATRAAIRWIRSKGITSRHMKDEAIELLVAEPFANREPPFSPRAAFLEFLALLASGTKVVSLLGTQINSEATCRDLVIVAPHCLDSEYTMNCPTKQQLEYLGAAAAQTYKFIVGNRFLDNESLLEGIFGTPTNRWVSRFAFNPSMRPKVEYRLLKQFKMRGLCYIKSKGPVELAKLMVDFDPALDFVNEIEDRFESYIVVRYDELGGSVVGIEMKSKSYNPYPKKEGNLRFAEEIDEDIVNASSSIVLEQIRILGGDLLQTK